MFRKNQRINSEEFKKVFEKSKQKNSKSFLFKFLKDEKVKKPKISVVIPKKVEKGAVKRNLLKRRFYNTIKEELKESFFPYYFIFIIKKEAKKISFNEIKIEIREVLNFVK